jgi:hypothetical protein
VLLGTAAGVVLAVGKLKEPQKREEEKREDLL